MAKNSRLQMLKDLVIDAERMIRLSQPPGDEAITLRVEYSSYNWNGRRALAIVLSENRIARVVFKREWIVKFVDSVKNPEENMLNLACREMVGSIVAMGISSAIRTLPVNKPGEKYEAHGGINML